MSKESSSVSIEFLLNRKFPARRSLTVVRGPSPHNGRAGLSEEQVQKLLAEVEEYRVELSGKSADDLSALVAEEHAKDRAERLTRAERDEQRHFFHKPHARADFQFWSRNSYWTIDEAVALVLGKAPEVVTWKTVERHVPTSRFAKEFARTRELVLRAKKTRQIDVPAVPAFFLAWAKRSGIDPPDELIKAVEATGMVIADWQSNYEAIKKQYDVLLKDRDEIADICRRLTEEKGALKARNLAIEERASDWEFDQNADDYPEELDIAMQAWRAVSNIRNPGMTVKQQLEAWVAKHYRTRSKESRERIAKICNWEKRGGRRPSAVE